MRISENNASLGPLPASEIEWLIAEKKNLYALEAQNPGNMKQATITELIADV